MAERISRMVRTPQHKLIHNPRGAAAHELYDQANDPYAKANNDVECPIKTCAHFIHTPHKVKAGQPFAITGLAQVGISGLKKVQYRLNPADRPLPEGDPYLTKGEWRDAIVLPPPERWGCDLPDGKLPQVMQVDPKTGQPLTWPIPKYHRSLGHAGEDDGAHELRCRTIDANGIPQPLPRSFGRSGVNTNEMAELKAEA